MPCPSMSPRWFCTFQIILVEYQLFRSSPICFNWAQIILVRSKVHKSLIWTWPKQFVTIWMVQNYFGPVEGQVKDKAFVFKKINHRYAWNSCTIWTSSESWLFRRNVKKMNQISRQKNQRVDIKDVQISTLETLITKRMPEKITKKDQFNSKINLSTYSFSFYMNPSSQKHYFQEPELSVNCSN